jgi:hypothetical protein
MADPVVNNGCSSLKEISYGKGKCICLKVEAIAKLDELIDFYIAELVPNAISRKDKKSIKSSRHRLSTAIDLFLTAYRLATPYQKRLVRKEFYSQFLMNDRGNNPVNFHPGEIDDKLLKTLRELGQTVPLLEQEHSVTKKQVRVRFCAQILQTLLISRSNGWLTHKGENKQTVHERVITTQYADGFSAHFFKKLFSIINKRLDEKMVSPSCKTNKNKNLKDFRFPEDSDERTLERLLKDAFEHERKRRKQL